MGIISAENIEARIQHIRGKKVILDRDLAVLYQVTTKVLNQAVKRNRARFPEDFMFRLTKEEALGLKSQIVISNSESSLRSQFVTLKRGKHIKYLPYAFTEQGVAMLSSVLHSRTAIQVNIQIMRTFVRLREIMLTHKDLWIKIDAMEKKYDRQFQVVFQAIKMLLEKPKEEPPRRF